MKTNKKIVFSILTIGILAVSASALTWAYVQDTITSTGNGVTTGSIKLCVDYIESDPNNVVMVPGTVINNVMLDKPIYSGTYVPERQIEPIYIQNLGTQKGKLYVQFQPTDEGLGRGSGVQINLYDDSKKISLYDNGNNLAPVTSDPVYICDVPPGGALTTLNLMYRLADTGENQNNIAGKELTFKLIFILSTK